MWCFSGCIPQAIAFGIEGSTTATATAAAKNTFPSYFTLFY